MLPYVYLVCAPIVNLLSCSITTLYLYFRWYILRHALLCTYLVITTAGLCLWVFLTIGTLRFAMKEFKCNVLTAFILLFGVPPPQEFIFKEIVYIWFILSIPIVLFVFGHVFLIPWYNSILSEGPPFGEYPLLIPMNSMVDLARTLAYALMNLIERSSVLDYTTSVLLGILLFALFGLLSFAN